MNYMSPDPWGKDHTYPTWDTSKTAQYKFKKSTPQTLGALFPNLDRIAIGYKGLLDELSAANSVAKAAYPPYDVVSFDNGSVVVNVAVAGFRREELVVTQEDRSLVIAGTREPLAEGETVYEGKFIHNGIAHRNFSLKFLLADDVHLEKAELSDGILTIRFEKIVPEEKQPKNIAIL